jgi:hypothetical protein
MGAGVIVRGPSPGRHGVSGRCPTDPQRPECSGPGDDRDLAGHDGSPVIGGCAHCRHETPLCGRSEVKSRFLAAASHDLRQPLQTIWSMQSVLARGTEKYGICSARGALVEEAVRNMDQMLSSLIDINRLEKGAIQPVIADFSLHEVLPPLRSEFGCAATG